MRSSNRSALLTTTLLVAAVLAAAVMPAAAASGHYEFTDDAYTAEQGEVVSITLSGASDANNTSAALAGENNTVPLRIGGEDVNFAVNATVVDENRDGNVTLELNTSTAGQANASSYLTAAGNDSVNATQTTEALPATLDAGDYSLALGPANNSTDTATLSLQAAETTTEPTETTETTEPTDTETTTTADETTETTTTNASASATTETTGTSDTGIPGFSAVLAVVALLAAAFLAVRR
ncbi:PGF-CTERM sorting domain-containing protein [Haloferax sp. Atlit-10N]|uniref:DUF7827 domain-containing protein n=1 Tax=unclassified Haloferax TaxID=2625095 RepID=UPI000E258996|nr:MULTISPECIES: PGF-CTERM sorting domain-containing protein [unclassified Haloferax]RDZ43104.1 PGF-CTERM sorting domain-containing protein [Haloferax sp. Atlit-16N]RDZ57678.1 PGF-CTERM sorting domain-containing protein [Haloferax sp. Atlit-10N]